MLFALLAGERGLIRLTGLMVGRTSLRNDISRLERRKAVLEHELSRYTSDDKTIERAAREELDLVRPGETVYKFPPEK